MPNSSNLSSVRVTNEVTLLSPQTLGTKWYTQFTFEPLVKTPSKDLQIHESPSLVEWGFLNTDSLPFSYSYESLIWCTLMSIFHLNKLEVVHNKTLTIVIRWHLKVVMSYLSAEIGSFLLDPMQSHHFWGSSPKGFLHMIKRLIQTQTVGEAIHSQSFNKEFIASCSIQSSICGSGSQDYFPKPIPSTALASHPRLSSSWPDSCTSSFADQHILKIALSRAQTPTSCSVPGGAYLHSQISYAPL